MLLGVIKHCSKAMDQNSFGFMYLNKVPKIIDAKIKE
jgi:hypothetical protein